MSILNSPNENTHNAPAELVAAAYKIALYFAERGIRDWSLGPIQKRRESTLSAPLSTELDG